MTQLQAFRNDFYWRRDVLLWRVFRAKLRDDGSIESEKPVSPLFWREHTAAQICNEMFYAYLFGRDEQRLITRNAA